MLGIFEKSTGKQPNELRLPSVERPDSIKTREDMAKYYLSWGTNAADATFYSFPKGNFMALPQQKDIDAPPQPRSVVVMDDICCIFFGRLDNNTDLRGHYGLPKSSSEAMIVFAAYPVLRDRAPYPADQVVKEFQGKYCFMLFDSKNSVVFLARDRDGGVELHWGTAADGSLVKAIEHKDDKGRIAAVVIQVDLHTRIRTIPRTGSGENWASASAVNKEKLH
ncbi:hypothetical protein ACH5RR_017888 [Cinchona calisaya]|uniref:DUF3700 domain-containing protein n=1 Tax=Cinchona calisaya TaxID=153742 RepID=A0ABD2ZKU4_9GENT